MAAGLTLADDWGTGCSRSDQSASSRAPAVTERDPPQGGSPVGLVLEYVSLAWMVVEAGVAIWAGITAGSIALVAFGLDSVIEFFAALIVISELRRGGRTDTQERAVKIIGVTFFVLAAYVTVESVLNLVNGSQPEASLPGIVVAGAALVVMPALALTVQFWSSKDSRPMGSRKAYTDAMLVRGQALETWRVRPDHHQRRLDGAQRWGGRTSVERDLEGTGAGER